MKNFKLKQIPERVAKPRESGLTMVMDKGLGLNEVDLMKNFQVVNILYVLLVVGLNLSLLLRMLPSFLNIKN